MKIILILSILTSSILLVGCHKKYKADAHQFLELVEKYKNTTVGCALAPAASCNSLTLEEVFFDTIGLDFETGYVEIKKGTHTHKDGRVVFKGEDLGFGTRFFGINFSEFDSLLKKIENLNETDKATAIGWFFIDNSKTYLEYDTVDHFYYQLPNGNWELYSENSSGPKDLEAIGANLEGQTAEKLGDKLTTEFGLSADRARAVAKNILAYNKISSKRSLTNREKNFFSNELLGTNFDQVMDSFSSGEGMEDLLDRAAEVNGTTPEQVSTIINSLFI
jgi:hypothetical protein